MPKLLARQAEILAVLRERAAPIAELYEAATRMMSSDFPAKLPLVAHCVREIVNRLPDYILGAVRAGKADYRRLVEELATEFANVGVTFDTPTTDGPPPTPTIDVSAEVSESLRALFREHRAATERSHDKIVRFLSIVDSEGKPTIGRNDPVAQQLISCHEWFMDIVHDAGPRLSDSARAERLAALPAQFAIFDSLLYSLLGGFFNNVSGLDDLLDSANRSGD